MNLVKSRLISIKKESYWRKKLDNLNQCPMKKECSSKNNWKNNFKNCAKTKENKEEDLGKSAVDAKEEDQTEEEDKDLRKEDPEQLDKKGNKK